jgi:integrase
VSELRSCRSNCKSETDQAQSLSRTLKATGKVRGPWVTTRAEAAGWLTKARGEAASGTLRRSTGGTLREAWEAFYAGAQAGTIHDRTGKPFKASTLRGYERGWKRIDPELGAHRLDAIRRADLQALVDRWATAGVPAATIRNSLDPIRTLYRRAIQRDQVVVNPTTNLDVPRVDNMRERFATREEAAALLAALPAGEQALWATAFYGGLRRGELRALRWAHIDLPSGLIRVQRAWDDVEGDSTPKTRAAVRRVPIVSDLARPLKAHKLATGRDGSDLVFGRSATEPFIPSTVRNRALAAWERANAAQAEALGRPLRLSETLTPIGLHEARHTFASLLIASGANAKALSVVMGHESISITFDRYGKLMPGGEQEVGRLLGAYLDGAATPGEAAVVSL